MLPITTITTFITLIFFVCLTPFTTYAQLLLRNEHDKPIQIAIAYLSDDDEKKWISEGWFSAEPGSETLLKEAVKVRYYYLYIVDNANNEWGGDGFELMVDEVEAFTIKKADKKYISDVNKTYKMHNFMEIDTGEKTKLFTYTFLGKKHGENTDKEETK
jgi:uncharacterized membrane protein